MGFRKQITDNTSCERREYTRCTSRYQPGSKHTPQNDCVIAQPVVPKKNTNPAPTKTQYRPCNSLNETMMIGAMLKPRTKTVIPKFADRKDRFQV
jgi:hypothetical protein